MSTHHSPRSGDIDARLQFLLQSTESLHVTVHEITGQIQEQSKQIEAQSKQIEAQSKPIEAQSRQIDAHSNYIEAHSKQSEVESKKIADLLTATGALLLISQSHKNRLDALDGGKPSA